MAKTYTPSAPLKQQNNCTQKHKFDNNSDSIDKLDNIFVIITENV